MRMVLATACGLSLMLATAASVRDDGSERKVKALTCTLKVSGMTCAGCEAAVRMAARSLDGVQDVTVSYAEGKADVTYDPAKTSPAAIAKVITKKSGFTADAVPPPGQKPRAKGN